jgi:hypothetical protein
MCVWSMIAGMSLIVTLSILVLFYIIMIAGTRMVSEGGMLYIHAPFRPSNLIMPATGSTIIGPSNLTILAYQEMILMFDIRSCLMPSVMDTLKLFENSVVTSGDRAPGSRSPAMERARLILPIFISIIVTMWLSYISILLIGYKHGGANLQRWFFVGAPQHPFRRLSDVLYHTRDPNSVWLSFMALGSAVTIFLTFMRAQFFWWPFHPIGYAMGPSWPMVQLWFSIFLGCLSKFIILRYGGLRVYARFRKFFLGMVLGEFLSGVIWLIIDFTLGKDGHKIFLS